MSDEYYDISVSACGLLSRVQAVETQGTQPYLACTFAALRGGKGERAEPTYFDVRVVGSRARLLLTQLRDVINDRARQVFASVRLKDLHISSFIYERGERKGDSGYAIKTRLLAIESLAIDGIVVYRRSEDPTLGVLTAKRSFRAPSGGVAAAPSPVSRNVRPVMRTDGAQHKEKVERPLASVDPRPVESVKTGSKLMM